MSEDPNVILILTRFRGGQLKKSPCKVVHLGSELLDHVLALKIPNLDGGPGGGAQPVPETGEVQ